MQVQELLQHHTGANALAQQSSVGRNSVEVLGLQKVYRTSKARYALAHPDSSQLKWYDLRNEQHSLLPEHCELELLARNMTVLHDLLAGIVELFCKHKQLRVLLWCM